MDATKFLESIKNTALWMFFTKHCKYCNTLVTKDKDLCEECSEHLPRIKGERCTFCGANKTRCGCKKRKMKFDGITSPFYYENGIREALQLLKFSNKTHIADTLAEDIAICIKKDFSNIKFDFVCFVPFSKAQKIERSYNQSELLAERISEKTGIPVEKALVKLFDAKTQHDMTNQLRKGNVFGVYDVRKGIDVKGKNILVIDDIMTTGETLNNCEVILKIRGAESVYCATAAITAKRKKKAIE